MSNRNISPLLREVPLSQDPLAMVELIAAGHTRESAEELSMLSPHLLRDIGFDMGPGPDRRAWPQRL